MKKIIILILITSAFIACEYPECNNKAFSYPGKIEKIAYHSFVGSCYILKYDGHEYILGPEGKTTIHSESCPCHGSISSGLGW